MFLIKENNLEWKKIAIGAGVVAVLACCGIYWLDIPLHNMLLWHNWHWLGIVDKAFETKIWLLASLVVFAAVFVVSKFLQNNTAPYDRHEKKSVGKNMAVRILDSAQGKIVWLLDRLGLSRFVFIDGFDRKGTLDKIGGCAFCVFVSVAMSSVVVSLLKFGFGRLRPVFYDAMGAYGFAPFSFGWALNSFPSGHSASAFAGFVMIGLLFPRAKYATWTCATIVGASRIFFGAHWPSDVIVGAFIGMLAADVIKWAIVRASVFRNEK